MRSPPVKIEPRVDNKDTRRADIADVSSERERMKNTGYAERYSPGYPLPPIKVGVEGFVRKVLATSLHDEG